MRPPKGGQLAQRKFSFWGWGYEDAALDRGAQRSIAAAMSRRFGFSELEPEEGPKLDQLELRSPRFRPPSSLENLCTDEPFERARHHYGRSYRDIVRGFRRQFPNPPDWIAYPTNDTELVSILDWCTDQSIAAIPFGGGSSVVGGVEARISDRFRGAISIDLSKLDAVLEIDRESRAARIQAGIYGPALEAALRPEGLTLRHFPQSFEFSTLGGWLATRSGGHYATQNTHIDDFVESMRVVTPSGVIESRRLPGSGAGPSTDRAFLGSEGSLGVITEAWMRLQDRPRFRASTSVRFKDFEAAVGAVRAISQSALNPANCRLLDASEARNSGAGDGENAVLILGFESADHELDPWIQRAAELCRDHGGEVDESTLATRKDADASRGGAAGAWRNAFLGAPYMRDAMVAIGVISETFETAVTWDRFAEFDAALKLAVRKALQEVCGAGEVSCRFTHVYPDGPAPYYTVLAPAKRGSEIAQWDMIKQAAADAIIANGGTITHHHAVGRDHMPWYEKQRSERFGAAMGAMKLELDPGQILNPGVLIKEMR